MTSLPEFYYYYDELSSIIYWTETQNETGNLEFLGSSVNPNKKMAVSSFTQTMDKQQGFKIIELP